MIPLADRAGGDIAPLTARGRVRCRSSGYAGELDRTPQTLQVVAIVPIREGPYCVPCDTAT